MFLARNDIPAKIRQEGDKRYKAEIRQALRSPALTANHRTELRSRLQQVGQPRIYDADSPPRPGAIEFPPDPRLRLMGLSKDALRTLARAAGLPISGTKTTLVGRLLAPN